MLKTFTTIDQLKDLAAVLTATLRKHHPIGLDYETFGPSIKTAAGSKPDVLRHRVWSYALAFESGHAGCVPLGTLEPRAQDYARRLIAAYLARPEAIVWAHTAKFELQVSDNEGWPSRCRWRCSQVAAWMAGWKLPGKGGLKLKPLSAAYLGHTGPDFAEVSAGRDVRDIPIEQLAPYNADDALLTLRLGTKAVQEFGPSRLNCEAAWELECACIRVTAHMEATGVTLDTGALLRAADACETEMCVVAEDFRRLTETTLALPTKVKEPVPCKTHASGVCEPGCVGGAIHFKKGKPRMRTVLRAVPTLAGADIGSDAQVARWLFDELGWWPKDGHPMTSEGEAARWSTKAEHITPFAEMAGPGGEAARLRLRFQALRKYATTYTSGLVELASQSGDGKLHTSYNQTGTDTSRYSSSQPNISNLPASDRQDLPWLANLPDVRAAFKPRPGWVNVIFDFSQIELRLMAHYSRDAGLLAAYPWDGAAVDLHQQLMDAVGCERRPAKVLRFSSLYRISAKRLATKLSLATNDWTTHTKTSAKAQLDALWRLHPDVPRYWDGAIAYAKERGYATTIHGFKRPLTKWDKEHEWHTGTCAVNTPIQGSAGGILKWCLVQLYSRWADKLGTRAIVGQTYDEVIVECHPNVVAEVEADMAEIMVAAGVYFKLRVPLAVDGGHGASWSEAKG